MRRNSLDPIIAIDRNDDGAQYDDDDAHCRSKNDNSKSSGIVVMTILMTAKGHEPQEDEME